METLGFTTMFWTLGQLVDNRLVRANFRFFLWPNIQKKICKENLQRPFLFLICCFSVGLHWTQFLNLQRYVWSIITVMTFQLNTVLHSRSFVPSSNMFSLSGLTYHPPWRTGRSKFEENNMNWNVFLCWDNFYLPHWLSQLSPVHHPDVYCWWFCMLPKFAENDFPTSQNVFPTSQRIE